MNKKYFALSIIAVFFITHKLLGNNCNDLNKLAAKYTRENKYELAIETAKKINKNCKGYLQAKMNIIFLYSDYLQNVNEAYINIKELNDYVMNNPIDEILKHDIAVMMHHGILLAKDFNYIDEMINISENLISFSKKYNLPKFEYKGYIWLGEIYRKKSQFEKSITNYSMATNNNFIDLMDKNKVYLSLAISHYSLRHFEEMYSYLVKAENLFILLNKKNKVDDKYLGNEIKYWWGLYYLEIGEKEKSKNIILPIMNSKQSNIISRDDKFFLYRKYGMKKEAYKILGKYKGLTRIKYFFALTHYFYKIPIYTVLIILVIFGAIKNRNKIVFF